MPGGDYSRQPNNLIDTIPIILTAHIAWAVFSCSFSRLREKDTTKPDVVKSCGVNSCGRKSRETSPSFKKGVTEMKENKDVFNLQLFAESGADNRGTSITVPTPDSKGNANSKDQANTPPKNTETKTEPKNNTEKLYTKAEMDEALDKAVNQRFARWMAEREKEEAAKLEADKLAKMTSEEKQKKKMADMEAEIQRLKDKETLADMSKVARGILDEKGIHISDELLSVLVTKDADKTNSNVEEFVSMFQKAVAEGVKERVAGKEPEVGASNAGGMTKEEIMKVKDVKERQRLIKENMNLWR